MNRLLIIIFLSASLAGCATMNRAECLNADWYMIGMEDGMRGALPSYIGKYRRACAKYNITPDLEAYRNGHNEGISQFCTKARGFYMGEGGASYTGICPPELEYEFLEGYNQGRRLHNMRQEINSISSGIRSDQNKLSALKKALKEKKSKLISDGTPAFERILLLEEINKLQVKIHKLDRKIMDQKEYKDSKEMEYQDFKALNIYE